MEGPREWRGCRGDRERGREGRVDAGALAAIRWAWGAMRVAIGLVGGAKRKACSAQPPRMRGVGAAGRQAAGAGWC